MKRVAGVALGLILGWALGTGVLLVVSVVLVGIGIPPGEQIIGIGLALLGFILAGGTIGFSVSKKRQVA